MEQEQLRTESNAVERVEKGTEKELKKQKRMRRTMNIITSVTTIIGIIFIIYGFKTDLFTSERALVNFLVQFGIWAPLIFIIFQAIQVIFPVIPGGLGLLAGVILFGPGLGFLYNYLGISLGSIVAFLLARLYGMKVINLLFSQKSQKKYLGWLDHPKFDLYFAIAIFAPIAPDDFLCYLAGTTKMKLSKFVLIILIGKPLAIAAYTYGLDFIFQHLVDFVGRRG